MVGQMAVSFSALLLSSFFFFRFCLHVLGCAVYIIRYNINDGNGNLGFKGECELPNDFTTLLLIERFSLLSLFNTLVMVVEGRFVPCECVMCVSRSWAGLSMPARL